MYIDLADVNDYSTTTTTSCSPRYRTNNLTDFFCTFQAFGQWSPRVDVFRTMEVFYGRTTTKMIQKMFLLAEIQFLYWIDRGRM